MANRIAELAKYHGKWSVFLIKPRVFTYIGKGKKLCKEIVDMLNH